MARTLDPLKRTNILKVARAIFMRDGYSAAKMSDIASEAGVAPGTLYLYFDSKEALSGAIGDDFFNRMSTQFDQVIAEIHGPDSIHILLDWALRIGEQERDLLAMVRDKKMEKCDKNDPKSPLYGRRLFVQKLADVLEPLMKQGIVRHYDDVTDLADIVLAVMHRMLMSHAIFQDSNSEHIKTTAVKLLQHSLFSDAFLRTLD